MRATSSARIVVSSACVASITLVALLALVTSACVRTVTTTEVIDTQIAQQEVSLRTATNLPVAFTVLTPPRIPGDCPPRLADPGMRVTLVLHESVMLALADTAGTSYRAFGDYTTEPPGRYGDLPGDYIRIDCVDLRALGIVPAGSQQR